MSDAEKLCTALLHFWMLGYSWGSRSTPSMASSTSWSSLVGELLPAEQWKCQGSTLKARL